MSDHFSKKNIYFTNNNAIHKRSQYNKVNAGCSAMQRQLYTGSVNIHNESVFQLELHMLYYKSGDVTHTPSIQTCVLASSYKFTLCTTFVANTLHGSHVTCQIILNSQY